MEPMKWIRRSGLTEVSLETDLFAELKGMPDSQFDRVKLILSIMIPLIMELLAIYIREAMKAGPVILTISLNILLRKIGEATEETHRLVLAKFSGKADTTLSAEFFASIADDSDAEALQGEDPGPLDPSWKDFIETLDMDGV